MNWVNNTINRFFKRNTRTGNNYVFVYGTLRKGNGLHSVMIRGNAEFIGMAKTKNKYEMYAAGCPFVNPDNAEIEITGEVYKIDDSLLKELDAVEGCSGNPFDESKKYGYFRKSIKVVLDNGRKLDAFIYFSRSTGMCKVPSGDFNNYKHDTFDFLPLGKTKTDWEEYIVSVLE